MTFRSLALLACAVSLAACEKNGVQDITGTPPGASVMFFNFGVGAPAVNFYANDTKMTAISSSSGVESTKGTNYGGVGAGGNYTGIAPGQYTLSGRIAADTAAHPAISSLSADLADGKYYSFYQSGVYDAGANTVDAFIVEDPLPPQDFTVAYVRFVNTISNSDPMTLYATNETTSEETAVGAEISYKGAGDFTALPAGVYDLATRTSGSATNVITRTAVSLSGGKVYTISAVGDMTVVDSPYLDNTSNR